MLCIGVPSDPGRRCRIGAWYRSAQVLRTEHVRAPPVAARTHLATLLEQEIDISGFAQILRALGKVLDILQHNPPQPLEILRHKEVAHVLADTRKV